MSANVSVQATESLELKTGEDVVLLRRKVREHALAAGFTLVEQTKVITAASELGRNTAQHGGGGQVRISRVASGARRGLQLEFIDEGPGIADIELAQQDGYSTGGGLGLGLGGARRLSDEFAIISQPGQGTRITIVRWKSF